MFFPDPCGIAASCALVSLMVKPPFPSKEHTEEELIHGSHETVIGIRIRASRLLYEKRDEERTMSDQHPPLPNEMPDGLPELVIGVDGRIYPASSPETTIMVTIALDPALTSICGTRA